MNRSTKYHTATPLRSMPRLPSPSESFAIINNSNKNNRTQPGHPISLSTSTTLNESCSCPELHNNHCCCNARNGNENCKTGRTEKGTTSVVTKESGEIAFSPPCNSKSLSMPLADNNMSSFFRVELSSLPEDHEQDEIDDCDDLNNNEQRLKFPSLDDSMATVSIVSDAEAIMDDYNQQMDDVNDSEGCNNTVDLVQSSHRLSTTEYYPLLLHEACILFPQNGSVIAIAITGCPESVLERTTRHDSQYCYHHHHHHHQHLVGYGYPLHLAILSSASFVVIQKLVEAGPSIMLQKDGPYGLVPLSLAIQTRPLDTALHLYLLSLQPKAASIPSTNNHDLPLHIALSIPPQQQPTETIRALLDIFPEAIRYSNVKGQIPMIMMNVDNHNSQTTTRRMMTNTISTIRLR